MRRIRRAGGGVRHAQPVCLPAVLAGKAGDALKWLNDIILFSFCRQSSNPEQLQRTARETKAFYKSYKRRKRRDRRA